MSPGERRFVAATALLVAAVTVSTMIAQLAGFACSSGQEPYGSLEADLCDRYAGELSFTWWMTVLWPIVAFAAAMAIPGLRRRALLVSVCLSVVALGFWIGTALVVIDT